jgi:hypothetical protein
MTYIPIDIANYEGLPSNAGACEGAGSHKIVLLVNQ